MYLGDDHADRGEVAQRISQYVQAFEALDAGTGRRARCWRSTSPRCCSSSAPADPGLPAYVAHPLGSLDDHAYVLDDAEITVLVVDPVFVERAVGLLDKCPGLKQVLTIGPVPRRWRTSARTWPRRPGSTPQPLEAVAAAARTT